ncbi:hypothetical protein HYH03_002093 [Edaphochlamys debaryana]|uniref:Uncharacterized protein n=1 Tax=Edaphochlamys debaryana TaxID=47281 RepID=A0A836C5K4_9CHLO|nr:hypothetical protein HYH03_002093 [Edaphochlamys debaryana]|eukprot:KAG2499797.1 hypothetical protein HYH03_002093 [Edaphochlamys debaryana]
MSTSRSRRPRPQRQRGLREAAALLPLLPTLLLLLLPIPSKTASAPGPTPTLGPGPGPEPRAGSGPRWPRCVGRGGAAVDWWLLLKEPNGESAVYTDSVALGPEGGAGAGGGGGGGGGGEGAAEGGGGCPWTLGLGVNDPAGPLRATLAAAGEAAAANGSGPVADTGFAFYNDADPEGVEHWGYAHSKGALLLGADGGAWVTHSFPRYPGRPPRQPAPASGAQPGPRADPAARPTAGPQHLLARGLAARRPATWAQLAGAWAEGEDGREGEGVSTPSTASHVPGAATAGKGASSIGGGAAASDAVGNWDEVQRPQTVYGQHALCLTLPYESLAAVAESLLVAGAYVYDAVLPDEIAAAYDAVVQLVQQSAGADPDPARPAPGRGAAGGPGAQNVSRRDLETAGGGAWLHVTKSQNFTQPFHEQVLEPLLGLPMAWETWRVGPTLPSLCPPAAPLATLNVRKVALPPACTAPTLPSALHRAGEGWARAGPKAGADLDLDLDLVLDSDSGASWDSLKDHSKWGFSTAGATGGPRQHPKASAASASAITDSVSRPHQQLLPGRRLGPHQAGSTQGFQSGRGPGLAPAAAPGPGPAAPNATATVTCFGDLNRQPSQRFRGGGFVCTGHAGLWRAVAGLAAELEPLSSAAGPGLAARRPLLAPLPRPTTQRRSPQPQRQRLTASAQAAAGSGPTQLPGGGGGGDAQQPSEPPSERPTGGELTAAAPSTAAATGPATPAALSGVGDAVGSKADRPGRPPPERAAPSADATPAVAPPARRGPQRQSPPADSDTPQRRCVSVILQLFAGVIAACIEVFPPSSSNTFAFGITLATLFSLSFVVTAAWMVWPELRSHPVRETFIGGLALGAGVALTAVTKSLWGALWASALCIACAVVACLWPRHREMILATALYALPCFVCLGAVMVMAANRLTAQSQQQRRPLGVAWMSAAPVHIWSCVRGK